MTARRRLAAVPAVAVLVTCATGALAYAGAVTLLALLLYVLPAVVVVGALTARLTRLSARAAAGLGLVAALVLGEVVNLVSGTGNGPAARSTFVAAAFGCVAMALAASPLPATFLVGVVGVVAGALGLGAGAEVAPVAVATAVVAVVALGTVEASARRWSGRGRGVVALLLSALAVGAVVAAVALQADHQRDGDPAVLAPGAVDATIRPPQALGDPDPPSPTPSSPPTPTNAAHPQAPEASSPDVAVVWSWVGIVVLLVLLLVAARLGWVWLRWRLLRRRLRRGPDADRVAGAWVWSVRRLQAAGWPVPASLSADRVASADEVAELPRTVRPALRRVAIATVDVVYAPPGRPTDADAVWEAADTVGRAAVSTLPRARRLGFAVRPVSSRPSPSTASAPGPTEEQRL